MFYIKLDKHMNLTIAVREAIYRGDHLNRTLTFLITTKVGDIDIGASAVYLSYIRADGTADIDLLNRQDDLYNETYYAFTMPVTSKLTRYAGPVTMFLTIYFGPCNAPVVAKSGECILYVQASTNMDEVITGQNLSLIYSMHRHMEDKLKKAEALLNNRIDKTNDIVATKADNIIFHQKDSTIQLVSTIPVLDDDGNEVGTEQIPLGDPIFVRTDNARSILNMEINKDGELIVTFDNEETQNLGNVVGKDGSVYVPRVDSHKVLTFTVETEPVGVPEPVNLNSNDEWADIGESSMGSPGVKTSYVWEEM